MRGLTIVTLCMLFELNFKETAHNAILLECRTCGICWTYPTIVFTSSSPVIPTQCFQVLPNRTYTDCSTHNPLLLSMQNSPICPFSRFLCCPELFVNRSPSLVLLSLQLLTPHVGTSHHCKCQDDRATQPINNGTYWQPL